MMAARHRAFAADFFNAVWRLLDQQSRTAAEDLRMIHLAHASRAHWQEAGGPREWAIGEWQIARVYAELGRSEPAVFHAQAAVDLAGAGQLGPFLAASSLEAMARALRVGGRGAEAEDCRRRALVWMEQVTDEEERGLLTLDLVEAYRDQTLPER
jgi:hypothetical protein